MGKYVLSRILQMIPAMFGIAVIAFGLISLAPGDISLYIAGQDPSPELVAQIRAEFGLDQPVHVQFMSYMGNLIRGNMGFSYRFGQPVAAVVLERVPFSLLLIVTALAIGTVMGLSLGMIAAMRKGTPIEYFVTVLALTGYSVPVFWLGQLLILVFALNLGWLPTQGMVSLRESHEGMAKVWDIAQHLALPATALGAWHMAIVARMTRSSVLEVMGQDYVRTARSKGLDEYLVVVRHALRNALIPVVTLVSYNFGTLLGGAVLTEVVFAWPGLGRLFMDAVRARDYPLLMGLFLVVSFGVMLLTLITDLLYGKLDPRIRFQ